MTYEYQYKNGIRIKIWIDEMPIQECNRTNIIEREYKADAQEINDGQIVVELKIPRNISNYGMLGMRYQNDLNTAHVLINISKYDGEIYEKSISIKPDIVHKGIPEDYVNGIIRSFEKNKGNQLKCGRYEFNVGAHGEVGSSEKIFNILTNIVLKILLEKEISEDVMKEILSDEIW